MRTRTHTRTGRSPHSHSHSHGASLPRHPAGFGIIELALILVVLGTLLFSFFEQRPPTRVSEAAFSRDFVLAWVEMADGYKEKTGRVLGDGRGNGGWRPVVDGLMDGVSLPDADHAAQEEIVAALTRAGLDPCARIRTAQRATFTRVCDGRDIFQAVPGGRAVLDAPSGVGLAHVYMPKEDRRANLVYFDHVPLETAREAARLVEQQTWAGRALLFVQPTLARWHAQNPQAPETFTAQPRSPEDFAAMDFVRLGVIVP